ncbi:DUF1801 domain-containing protein [Thalassotalea profundi]|uniref:YdhG-like domain-containing protein n=1 Tax=Thalassotalea profundi TaxID=2036687 RepID=A0ABQ3IY16_9GAMM|nr:DUF1801 domain-containing protein [Thalassotalea profundi]GHE98183.1 hypothetical protein GCM10011501_29640 [Thalassotalea profundi]
MLNCSVKQKFETYPKDIAISLHTIRDLILRVAAQEGISDLIETLKWGEPSYTSKIGSSIRFDWKAKSPEQYYVYFNCKTTLIETFKEVYGNIFIYEGNRALVFNRGQALPVNELSHCISLSLRYKKIKHLPLLGL